MCTCSFKWTFINYITVDVIPKNHSKISKKHNSMQQGQSKQNWKNIGLVNARKRILWAISVWVNEIESKEVHAFTLILLNYK